MKEIGIVVIGYNNPQSLNRLLEQLNKVCFRDECCELIISLDKSDNDATFSVANAFEWKHGLKRVVIQKERLGLRQHIIKCGQYMMDKGWDAQIVLEDDIFVSREMYRYSRAIVEKYSDNMEIAGAALYAYNSNRVSGCEFIPISNGNDAYFVQYAASWGQIWFKKQWQEFMNWYELNKTISFEEYNLPKNVSSWDENSWLKYHIAYCVVNNKYFVFPYRAYSTCFSEKGEHTYTTSDICQIELTWNHKYEYSFPDVDFDGEDMAFYDVYFENKKLARVLDLDEKEVEIDLAGYKPYTDKRFILSSRRLDYKIIQSWGKSLKPVELNILESMEGDSLFLYDTGVNTVKMLPESKKEKSKFEDYFYILDHWMRLKYAGRNLDEYFIENGIKTIAIYGFGKIGKLFFQELKNSNNVKVEYAIDKNNSIVGDIKVIHMCNDMPKVDAIVVSAISDFKEIEKNLTKITSSHILSLGDIVGKMKI